MPHPPGREIDSVRFKLEFRKRQTNRKIIQWEGVETVRATRYKRVHGFGYFARDRLRVCSCMNAGKLDRTMSISRPFLTPDILLNTS